MQTLSQQLAGLSALQITEDLTLDFAAVSKVDSSAISYVLHAQRLTKGYTLTLTNLPTSFYELANLYEVDHLLPLPKVA